MSSPDIRETTAADVSTGGNLVETADTVEEESIDCCCCHCQDVKRAIQRAKFLKTPAGQRRLNMKLAAKNFFMDFMAMGQVRKQVRDALHCKNDQSLARHHSFPVSICEVEEVTEATLLIKWWVHDDSDVDRYAIYIDNQFVKSVFDASSDKTIVSGIDANKAHHIRMKAVPKRMADRKYRDLEESVRDICCICPTPKLPVPCSQREMLLKPLQKKYFTNLCATTSETWADSEFLYIPDCECDTYV